MNCSFTIITTAINFIVFLPFRMNLKLKSAETVLPKNMTTKEVAKQVVNKRKRDGRKRLLRARSMIFQKKNGLLEVGSYGHH